MQYIFFLFLLINFAITAMEEKKSRDNINNNNACPLILQDKKARQIKCGACNEDSKAAHMGTVGGGVSFGLAYYTVQKLFPDSIYADNFLLRVVPVALIIAIPVYNFTQTYVDYYLNKIPWNQQCSICSTSSSKKWNRGKISGTSLLVLLSGSLLYHYLKY